MNLRRSSPHAWFLLGTMLLVALGMFVWGLRPPGDIAEPATSSVPSSSPSGTPDSSVLPGTKLIHKQPKLPAVCRQQATTPFTLARVQLRGVGTYGVEGHGLQPVYSGGQIVGWTLYVPEDDNPSIFGWDTSMGRVGKAAIVRLTAHTWDTLDSALGNVLQREMSKGSLIVLHGTAGETACFRVSSIMHVNDEEENPRQQRAIDRLNGLKKRDDLGIVVCSGLRVAAGVYTERTIFFATRL